MADVSSDLKNWSTTAASNGPSGTTSIGTGLDDNLQEIQKVVRQDLAFVGSDIASASTTDLGAVKGSYHNITGTTTITSFGTVSAGISKWLKFAGALVLTHNATSLILPSGANITTAAGDACKAVSLGSGNWIVTSYSRATGRPLVNPSNMVDTLSSQTLTNKTLTSPTIASPTFSGTAGGSLSDLTLAGTTTVAAFAGAGVATQANMESASATSVVVTPGRQQFHPLHPKAWVRFAGSNGATTSSSGVSNVTKNGTGDYTVSFSTAFSSSGYAPMVMHSSVSSGSQGVGSFTFTTSTCRFETFYESPDGSTTNVDPSFVVAVFWGDQ